MHPAGLMFAMMSFWSLFAIGVYLVISSIGSLRAKTAVKTVPVGQRQAGSWARLAMAKEGLFLLLGLLLVFEGVFFSYAVFYWD